MGLVNVTKELNASDFPTGCMPIIKSSSKEVTNIMGVFMKEKIVSC